MNGVWTKYGQLWEDGSFPEDESIFNDWASELSHIYEIAIKRTYLSKNPEVVSAYASLEAMSTVTYFPDKQTE